MKKIAIVFLISVSVINHSSASSGNNDKSLVRKGDRAFRKAKIADALAYYLKALTVNPQDCYANFQAGAIYYLTDSARMKSLPYFQNTIKYAPAREDDTIIDAYYYLGNCYILKKDYNSAINAFHDYLVHLEDDKLDADILKEVKRNIDICMQAPELMQRSPDSASFIINGKYQPTYVKNLGSMINTPYPEYAEVLLNHDSTIIFTSRRPTSQHGKRDYPTGSYYEDIFISNKDKKGQWMPPNLFSDQLHIKPSRLNLASVCISADNKTLFVYNKGRVYESHKTADGWTKPERIGKNIKNFKKYIPSVFLSFDGKKLLLVSDQKGGYGGRDIYMSNLDDKGIWSSPQNLGSDINSAFDEDAPFLMPDNKTLYFSSKGHNGIGGYDIFKSVYENGKWSTPVNLGVPVNSPADDIFFSYDTATKMGYFSSSRINEGYGDVDLYSVGFTCDNIQNTTLQGKLVADVQKNISSATIDLTETASQQTTEAKADENGKYSLQLKPDTKYTVSVKAPGYLTSSTNITTPHQCDPYNLYQVISLNYIDADSLHKGQNISIKNAFYHDKKDGNKNAKDDPNVSALMTSFNDQNNVWLKDTGFAVTYSPAQIDSLNPHASKTNIASVATPVAVTSALSKAPTILFEINKAIVKNNYYASLDSLARMMHTNTKIKLQVTGYADNTGKPEHNLALSRERARSVEQYLVRKQVKASNIHTDGKGIADPVAPNDGTHNYLNRRAELIIIQ